jgi:hypothetical protein
MSKRRHRKPGAATQQELAALFGALVEVLTAKLREQPQTAPSPALLDVVRCVLKDAGITAEIGSRAKQAAALAMLGDMAREMALPFSTKPLGMDEATARGKKGRR